MSDNVRFHSKWHGKNHHTLPTPGYYDSARDPIAGPGQEFMGDFYLSGAFVAITTPELSANLGAKEINDILDLQSTIVANSANWKAGSKWTSLTAENLIYLTPGAGGYNKVGIGEVNPGEELTVAGDISANGIVFAGFGNNTQGLDQDRASSNTWNWVAANSASAGTFDSAELAANSGTWDATYSDVKANSANWNSTYNQVQDSSTDLNVDSNTLVVDKSVNNVGIGTASPFHKLHVDAGGSTTVAITANGTIHASGDITAFSTSDKQLKNNIVVISDPIGKVQSINGVMFEWADDAPDHLKGVDYGVIAQEIEEVLPLAVTTRDTGHKAVKYEKIIPLLIEAVKDQQKQIDELKAKLEE